MGFTETEKRELAARAQLLEERLAEPGGAHEPTLGESIEELVETWQENVADGDPAGFRRRLRIDDVDPSELTERLAACEYLEDEPLPEWVGLLDDLQTALETESEQPAVDDGGAEESPFEHLLEPIVAFAVEQLDRPKQSDRIAATAVEGAADELADQLEDLFGHALFVEFKFFLGTEDAGDEGNPASRVGYREFVETQLADGFRSLFLFYPVLARWTAVILDQWTAALEEFTGRLERDWETVERSLGDGEPLGRVVDLSFAGDRHHGGRQVFEVTFDAGRRVAYKPRGLEPEATYYEFLAWLNDESPLPDMRIVDCVPRDEYGWMEWVEPAACQDEQAAARYFERAGALTCLAYLLRFADGHIENIVAAGDQPVFLDLETLLQPDLPEEHVLGDPTLAEILDETVLKTGILPREMGDDDVQDVAGIHESRGTQTGLSPREFTDVNTDAMELEFEDVTYIEGESLPRVDGETRDPRKHVEELVDGFSDAYQFVLDERERILADGGPLDLFADLETRFFYRDTATYAKIRRPLATSSYLRSGLACGIRLEHLTSWIDWDEFDDAFWTVYEAERDAMWQRDVPRFTLNTSGTDLYLEDTTLESALSKSPLECVRQRIAEVDREDLDRQLDLLLTAYDRERLVDPQPPREGFVSEDVPSSWEAAARRECEGILERLRAAGRRDDSDDVVWYRRENSGSGVTVRQLRDDIYDGRLGIGVYAAAMADAFDREDCRQLASTAAAPLLHDLEAEPERFGDKKLGAGHGLGALVYGFTKMGAWLDEPEYVQAASKLSRFFTEERLVEDDVYDLVGGGAGAIVGLLALYDETGEQRVLDRAETAGAALLDDRRELDGVPAWPTYSEDEALIGPAHGISGIALALHRLGAAVDRPAFQRAAIESLEYEDRQYSEAEGGWPDVRCRGRQRETYRSGWCAGLSGIGLTRIAMLEQSDDDADRELLERDLHRTLDAIDHQTLMREDDICCGNFSRVEFLVRASDYLDEPEYYRQAEQIAAGALDRAAELDGYTIAWQTDHWYTTSLYLGEMGLGYGLLRLAGADLPNLLLFE